MSHYYFEPIWGLFILLPVAAIIIFTVLTCLKVKNEVIEENASVVRSVVKVNILNVISYVVLRTIAVMLYYLGTSLDPSQHSSDVWTMVARYIGELNYTLTVLSILIIHSNIRNRILNMTLFKLKFGELVEKSKESLNSS